MVILRNAHKDTLVVSIDEVSFLYFGFLVSRFSFLGGVQLLRAFGRREVQSLELDGAIADLTDSDALYLVFRPWRSLYLYERMFGDGQDRKSR